MGVGNSGSNNEEWIRRLTPALRTNAAAGLNPALGAAALSASIGQLGEAPVRWCIAVAAEMTRAVFAQMPELPQTGDVFEEARAGSEANVLAVLRSLASGEDEADLPPAAAEFARRSVRRGIPLATILHGYRLGHEFLVHELQGTVAGLVDGASLGEMQRAVTASFHYVDAGVDRLVEEYEAERGQWAGTAAARRAETVHAILAGKRLDPGSANAVLGYPLDRTHVAAILWRSPGTAADGHALEGAAQILAAQLAASRPLLVSLEDDVLWMWAVPGEGSMEPAVLSLDGAASGVRAAVGEAEQGVAGFRRSHEAADEAARIARLCGDEGPPVSSWKEVSLLSLVTADLDEARSFVRRELGGLAADGMSDLRETVRSFLAHRGSHAAAARDLFVHRNTVAYRLAQAEEVLGHPVADRELELRIALEVAATLGPSLLSDG